MHVARIVTHDCCTRKVTFAVSVPSIRDFDTEWSEIMQDIERCAPIAIDKLESGDEWVCRWKFVARSPWAEWVVATEGR